MIVLVALGCGGHAPVPKRLVVESDVGEWKFRRFQGPLVDVEVWIEGNRGEAYTASYITSAADKRGRIEDGELVNVFVTRYEKPDGVVRSTVKFARRLAQEQHYQVEETKVAGTRALAISGVDEAWLLWPSTKFVVKVGGRGLKSVPEGMIEPYADRFPSQLPGGALEGPLPPGPDDAPKRDPKEPYDPNNPRPDLDKYDPAKTKLPKSK